MRYSVDVALVFIVCGGRGTLRRGATIIAHSPSSAVPRSQCPADSGCCCCAEKATAIVLAQPHMHWVPPPPPGVPPGLTPGSWVRTIFLVIIDLTYKGDVPPERNCTIKWRERMNIPRPNLGPPGVGWPDDILASVGRFCSRNLRLRTLGSVSPPVRVTKVNFGSTTKHIKPMRIGRR